MTEVKRKVTLLAHTQLTEKFKEQFDRYPMGEYENELDEMGVTDAKALALTAIRTCYSAGKPSEILLKEGKRYFGKKATDGGKGTDADRLIRMIQSSGHTSTLEGVTFNFAVEGVSRALLAQLTRHRVGFSFSVQSQRYVKFGTNDKSGGFDYVMPEKIASSESPTYLIENYYGDEVGVRHVMEPAAHADERPALYGDLVHELAVEIDELPVARDGRGAGELVSREHGGKVAIDAPRAGGEVDAGLAQGGDRLERVGRDDVILSPDEGGVEV